MTDKNELVVEIIRLAHASTARLCIVPLQDYLLLDNKARMNEPSTLGKNWKWRLLPGQLTAKAGMFMKEMSDTYGRTPRPQAEESPELEEEPESGEKPSTQDDNAVASIQRPQDGTGSDDR